MRPIASSVEALPVTAAPKKRSKAQQARDLRRAARHNAALQSEVRSDRIDASARSADVNEFMADRLDRRQRDLDAEKLKLRGEVRHGLGTTENESFWGRS